MVYLTKDVDINKILKDPIVTCQGELWTKMAFAEDAVDLFDEESWTDEEYVYLVNIVHQRIATCSLRQQQCENYV